MAAKQRTREVTKSHWESRGRLSSSSEVFNVPHVRPRGRTLKALNERASSHFTPLSGRSCRQRNGRNKKRERRASGKT